MGIKGYKAMSKDMECRGFKFQVGETYTINDSPILCQKGFHYCENPFDVYEYYDKSTDTLICEIEDLGSGTKKEGNKSATNKIKIVRLLTDIERLNLWIKRTNSGHYNSGHYNSGNYNSCNYNSGNSNSGHYNSGDSNSGNSNSGNYNSGNYNSGDRNSGAFNTDSPNVQLFNKDSGLTFDSKEWQRISNLPVKPILRYVPSSEMTEEEKANNKSHVTTGGFLRNTGRQDWSGLTEDDKKFIKSLPNFDDAIFQQITGVSLSDDIEVIVNGVTKRIPLEKAKELGLV